MNDSHIRDIFSMSPDGLQQAEIRKMFNTHGPYLLNEKRLDMLKDIIIVADSSVSTYQEVGSGSSKTATGSLIGRSLVGGFIAGPAGAIILGGSAKKNETYSSSTTETKSVEYTTKLVFSDESAIHVVVKSINSLQWLLGFAGSNPASADQLAHDQKLSESVATEASIWNEVYVECPTPVKQNTKQTSSYLIGSVTGGLFFLWASNYLWLFFAFIAAGIVFFAASVICFQIIDSANTKKHMEAVAANRIQQKELFDRIKMKKSR